MSVRHITSRAKQSPMGVQAILDMSLRKCALDHHKSDLPHRQIWTREF